MHRPLPVLLAALIWFNLAIAIVLGMEALRAREYRVDRYPDIIDTQPDLGRFLRPVPREDTRPFLHRLLLSLRLTATPHLSNSLTPTGYTVTLKGGTTF